MQAGFSHSIQEARPPYVRFETRPIEKRQPDSQGGGVMYIDTDFAIVTSHGSKDTVEKIVDEWFPRLKDEVRQGRFPQAWLDAYRGSYRAWKEDQAPPVNGTAIRNWPSVSPAEVKRLTDLGIIAIEDLAQANEELISKLGMGGRSLKQRAQDYVTAATGTAPLIAQLDSMRRMLEGMQNQVNTLTQRNEFLQTQLTIHQSVAAQARVEGNPVHYPSPEDRLAQMRDTGPRVESQIADAIDEVLGS